MAAHVSSISQALLGNTDGLSIPKPPSVGDVVFENDAAAMLASKGPNRSNGLPTPPNSISPNLPPHAFKAKFAREAAASPPDNFDSDIDLQDAVDHANSHGASDQQLGSSAGELGTADGVGAITPAYLARNFLPGIVLDKGPIAIRHVMNDLAQTVPGFSDIPPAKARRIVVAGLESSAGGGPNGDVEFEKVGWGRWDARIKGQPAKDRAMYSIRETGLPSQAHAAVLAAPTGALAIPGGAMNRQESRRMSYGSWADDSISSRSGGHHERMDTDMAEYEADKMSIDGEHDREPQFRNVGGSLRSAAPQDSAFYSDTDEEDWASMGAAALGQGSYPRNGGRERYLSTSSRSSSGRPWYPSFPRTTLSHSKYSSQYRTKFPHTELSPAAANMDPLEREAAEALMRMGAM